MSLGVAILIILGCGVVLAVLIGILVIMASEFKH